MCLDNLFPDDSVFYHGTSTECGIDNILIPPNDSKFLSEVGRTKNLDRIFFTKDIGLAKIYAGRTSKLIGGDPVVYRVVSPVDVVCMNNDPGASVYHASWSFCEVIERNE